MKTGDRIVITNSNLPHFKIGEMGTIVEIMQDTHPDIGIVFDEYNNRRHDNMGTCEQGYGYYIYPNQLRVIDAGEGIEHDIQSLKDKYPNYSITVVFDKK